MVALSQENNRAAVDDGRVEIVQGDAGDLPWPDASFTAAANMFMFVREPKRVLAEMFRVLEPGGRFAMV